MTTPGPALVTCNRTRNGSHPRTIFTFNSTTASTWSSIFGWTRTRRNNVEKKVELVEKEETKAKPTETQPLAPPTSTFTPTHSSSSYSSVPTMNRTTSTTTIAPASTSNFAPYSPSSTTTPNILNPNLHPEVTPAYAHAYAYTPKTSRDVQNYQNVSVSVSEWWYLPPWGSPRVVLSVERREVKEIEDTRESGMFDVKRVHTCVTLSREFQSERF
ncbi:hypothetical protein FB446DRAFT_823736 [Lentinula raphanica]|nr:hypothetical protein FB446DRAFT_823736 [Lentinula raphanica]